MWEDDGGHEADRAARLPVRERGARVEARADLRAAVQAAHEHRTGDIRGERLQVPAGLQEARDRRGGRGGLSHAKGLRRPLQAVRAPLPAHPRRQLALVRGGNNGTTRVLAPLLNKKDPIRRLQR